MDKKGYLDSVDYKNHLSLKNKLARLSWQIVSLFLFRPFGLKIFNPWRIFLLRCFGAKLHPKAIVYSSVKIWAPWNLQMDELACIGPGVDCYNVAVIKMGVKAIVSQRCFLCTASHDMTLIENPLIHAPIIIEDKAWIGAEAYLHLGITIGQGAVVGARGCVYKSVDPWVIVGGNPAKFIKKREITNG